MDIPEYRERINHLVQQEVEKGQIAGACVKIIMRDAVLYEEAIGYADLENRIQMQENTIFRLFSLTKPVTSAAVMILAERGEIDLSDPVSKYLPAFAKPTVWKAPGIVEKADREITLWDLLHMVSGITGPGGMTEPGLQMEKIYQELIHKRICGDKVDTQEYLNRISEVPLINQPGEIWLYGLSADVLGGVIEAAAGMKFGEFLQKELFTPLEMRDTGFFVPRSKANRFAQIYEWKDQSHKLEPYTGCFLGEYYGEDVAFESGGAGLVSTIDDYSHFTQMMLHKGEYNGRRILGRKTVEFMTQNHLTSGQRQSFSWDALKGYGYGCLMRVLIDQSELHVNASLGEYGWDGWTGTYVSMSPEDQLAVLYFIQRCGAGTTAAVRKIRMMSYSMVN